GRSRHGRNVQQQDPHCHERAGAGGEVGSEAGDPVDTWPVPTSLIDQVATAKTIAVSFGKLRSRRLTSRIGSLYQIGQTLLVTLNRIAADIPAGPVDVLVAFRRRGRRAGSPQPVPTNTFAPAGGLAIGRSGGH